MTKLIGIVAAGGYASRMGILEPKPMVTVEGKTLLEYTLISLQLAGVKNILVFSNRTDYFNQQYKIVQKLKGIQIVEDYGVSSTIELLYMAREICTAKKYLFCYGNAPRTSDIYREMADCKKELGAIIIKESSRRDLIQNGDCFLEPPFFIDETKVRLFRHYRLWSELFHDCTNNIYHRHVNAPPEFNDHIGWYKYRHCIYNYIIDYLGPNKANALGKTKAALPFGRSAFVCR